MPIVNRDESPLLYHASDTLDDSNFDCSTALFQVTICTGSSHGKFVQPPIRLYFVTISPVKNCLARLAIARERTPRGYKFNECDDAGPYMEHRG